MSYWVQNNVLIIQPQNKIAENTRTLRWRSRVVSVFGYTISNKCSNERRRREQIGTLILADSKAAFMTTGEIRIIITV
jgi:hypothetical protein